LSTGQIIQHQGDPEKVALKALFNLNTCAMAIRHKFEFPNRIRILIDFFKNTFQLNKSPPNGVI